MRVIFSITTYNRLPYLKQTLETLDKTKNNFYDWFFIASDDGSSDGTIEYLKSYLKDRKGILIQNNRRGIHHQTNQILKVCHKIDFDFAFKSDDDLVFYKPGWDDLYITGAKKSGFDHLVFHDTNWLRVEKKRDKPIPHPCGYLECRSLGDQIQGAFWTFTKRVIKNVGFVDIKNFGLCGFGHRDYTKRCCKLGFNAKYPNVFDIRNAEQYIRLVVVNYESAPDRQMTWNYWNSCKIQSIPNRDCMRKLKIMNDGRTFVRYKEFPINLYGQKL